MDVVAKAHVSAGAGDVLAALADLGTYPHWLSIVGAAVPVGDSAWEVDLVGRVGPFTRTKRVRMVRVAVGADETGGLVRFERQEHDGERHHEWVLTASAVPASPDPDAGTAVEVHLRYSGPMLPGVDLLLRREAANAGARLDRYLLGFS